MAKYISLGKFNKNHIYIILSIICLILRDIISGYNYNDSFQEVIPIKAQENFSEHNLINHIFYYIGTFILSLIFYIVETRNNSRNSINALKKKDKKISDKDLLDDNIIYIRPERENITFSKNFIYWFILLIFLWIIEEHLIEIYSILKDLDFLAIEIIIASLLNSKMFHLKIFRHHILVYFINFIPILLKIVTIILSFNDEGNQNYIINNTTYYEYCYNNNSADCKNVKDKLKNLYVIYWWLVPVGIITYLFLITLRIYVYSKLKWFMDLKYMSANKILMIYGLLGTILCSITCTITTFKSCEEITSEKKDLYDYICFVKNNQSKFFDNFYIYFENINIIIILRYTLIVILFFFNKYFAILIIKFFTPVHLIISFPIYYIIQKIVLIINTLIREHSFFNETNFKFKTEKFILDLTGDIVSIIGFFIYLEIIEINICKLNYNLRRYIIIRGNNELYDDYLDNGESRENIFDEEDQREEIEGNDMNNNS